MQLVKWDKIKTAIETATDIQELTALKNKLRAYQILAEQSKQSQDVQAKIAIYKARADRKCGGWLKDNVKHDGAKGVGKKVGNNTLPTGVAKNESSRLQKIANIPDDKFEGILQEAEVKTKKITNNMLVNIAKEAERETKIQNIKTKINSNKLFGKYDVVILDPPWAYGRKYDAKSSRVASPYPEQSQKDIHDTCKGLFKPDCVLWLWTTHQFIWQAKDLLAEWGFEYKAILTWNKEIMGMGAWLRMQCEFCLLGIKGNPMFKNTTERDIIIEKRREHSRKPKAFYDLVKKTCYGSIFEYYSREKKEGIITAGVEDGKMGR